MKAVEIISLPIQVRVSCPVLLCHVVSMYCSRRSDARATPLRRRFWAKPRRAGGRSGADGSWCRPYKPRRAGVVARIGLRQRAPLACARIKRCYCFKVALSRRDRPACAPVFPHFSMIVGRPTTKKPRALCRPCLPSSGRQASESKIHNPTRFFDPTD